ncbi:MAG: enhanced serine sensitivity protein SseB C-terminal domain-containing protein [Alphaproteobacteria bacterium]|nr:enhanced serine sensitivity protein SseB C-terminal domain-containing protein [Alphaproteobacteria bacterium]MBL6937293.1 enhanced serine sensitivity protein SseB C-terminal domain-containing protein [Alphaproteobacteria bacterium]MBL7096145.1 enhanced serine sensitivity protein SseB C-terminal domain-containing protein [Alphaproteobacteria bacterium]
MAFVPENALEEALDRAATDPMARVAFFHALMESPLVVMGQVKPAEGTDRQQLTISALRHNGRSYHAIFTADSRLSNFAGSTAPRFTIQARQLFETTKGAHFALNPNCERGKLLMAPEIGYWLDPGSARAHRQLRLSGVHLTPPAAPPRLLTDALSVLFRNRTGVLAAYLLESEPLDHSEPRHPVVGITFDGEWRRMAAEVSELAAAVAPSIILDVVHVVPGQPDPIAERLANEPPFYVRQANLH